nr:MAG TPA: DNA pilot protein VP2 [Microviridae sp.]
MANIGSSAASGAALGSSISPGLGTLIGGIGGAAISAIGSFFGNRSNRKASAEAFERESKFAREERLAQQQWIEQMYEKNNSYNSPAAQMQRLKDAGLNPDLMYSRGDVGNATAPEAPQQAMTPRYNVIPTNTYGQTAQLAADAGLKAAQARLANSQSKKTDTEESLLTADYLLRKARTESDIELNNSTIYVNHELGQLNHAEAEVAAKKLQEIDVAMSEARERINTMKAQQAEIDEKIVQLKFDRYLRSQEFELLCKKTYQEMKESNSRIALNAAEVQDMLATQMARVMNLNASTYMMKKQGMLASEQTMTELYKQTGIDISNQHAKFNFDQAKDWDTTERFTNVATTWINSVSFAVGQFAGATTSLQKGGFLGKSMSPIGFR